MIAKADSGIMISGKIRQWGGNVSRALAARQIYVRPRERRLAALEGKHDGQRAFILGMGPSLKVDDLNLLKNELTFACNKIFLAFKDTDFRPSYYSVCDILVAENNYDRILETDFGKAQAIHARLTSPWLSEHKGALFYEYCRKQMLDPEMEANPTFPKFFAQGIIGGGCSILIDQIQIAWLMGCREIVVLGLDFSFSYHKEDLTGEGSRSGEVLESKGEVNHFHRDYRKPGEKWTVPMMDEQRRGFDYCRKFIEMSGGRLLNASRTSKLDVLPRVDLEELLKD